MVGLEFAAQEGALSAGPLILRGEPSVLPGSLGMLFLESIGCVLTPVLSSPRPLSMPSQPHRRQWMGPLGSCGGMAEVLPRTLSQHLLGLLRL